MDIAKTPKFSVAPMMDWTDRHCRFLHRQLTRHTLLFTEMVTSAAIVHGDQQRLLAFDDREQPVALQLGGSDPKELQDAARIGASFGYCEININVGCPSDRVQSGTFGACLMREPERVSECVMAMQSAVEVPVTVKCRLGVDEQDIDVALDRFADLMVAGGADAIYVHARKAWLQGLSPKDNRTIPPLDHARVYRLAERLAPLPVIINGGIDTLDEAERHLASVQGVMLGRAAYHNPLMLLDVDRRFFEDERLSPDMSEIIEVMMDYAESQMTSGVRLNHITRHMIGLANGMPGARRFRQILSTDACRSDASPDLIGRAFSALGATPTVFQPSARELV